jgi:hypothetical protein
MGDAVADIVGSGSGSGVARTLGNRPWPWGDDHGSGSRSGSANDAACDTADRCANGTAYDGSRNRPASRAGKRAVAVGKGYGWQGCNGES